MIAFAFLPNIGVPELLVLALLGFLLVSSVVGVVLFLNGRSRRMRELEDENRRLRERERRGPRDESDRER